MKKEKSAEAVSQQTAPAYLVEFHSKCVATFDTQWVCDQIIRKSRPVWFRSMLTRMLVGWAICGDDKEVRKSLAWHYINGEIDKAAKDRSQSNHPSYYVRAIAQFFANMDRFQKIYRPLGGFQSKRKYSSVELVAKTSASATAAKGCVPVLSLLAYRCVRAKGLPLARPPTLAQAIGDLEILYTIYDDIRRSRDADEEVWRGNMLSTSGAYQTSPLSPATFKERWSSIKTSGEFVAAMAAGSVPWTAIEEDRGKAIRKLGVKKLSVLDAIANGGINRLPYSSAKFQRLLATQAKFLSLALRQGGTSSRLQTISETIKPKPFRIDVFSSKTLDLIRKRRPLSGENG